MSEVCKHNVLRRACSQCDDKETIAELNKAVDDLIKERDWYHDKLEQNESELRVSIAETKLKAKQLAQAEAEKRVLADALCEIDHAYCDLADFTPIAGGSSFEYLKWAKEQVEREEKD